jgi:hypothetical protein
MAEGATGTEIFTGLRWRLERIKKLGVPLSGVTRGQVDELLKELERA